MESKDTMKDAKIPCGKINCPIMNNMLNYQFTNFGLEHLRAYNHKRINCRYGDECFSFVRLRDGGNRFDDECHMAVFWHPPRTTRILE